MSVRTKVSVPPTMEPPIFYGRGNGESTLIIALRRVRIGNRKNVDIVLISISAFFHSCTILSSISDPFTIPKSYSRRQKSTVPSLTISSWFNATMTDFSLLNTFPPTRPSSALPPLLLLRLQNGTPLLLRRRLLARFTWRRVMTPTIYRK